MFREKFQNIVEGYTFDDVLLKPLHSSIEPKNASVASKFSRHINIGIPIVSSPMDTVTEDPMAIAMARYGALGVIHRNMSANEQVEIIKKLRKRRA